MTRILKGMAARLIARVAIASALLLATVQPALAARPGYAAILVDANTGEVLYANAADQPRHPASITKIMTLYLTFEALSAGRLRLSDQVVMSRFAASQKPSRLGLLPGRSLTVDDALRVIAVKSANDVAVALAEKLGGSEADFAAMMTAKARALGMSNTLFVNASGLPNPAHITTARDISTLSLALIRDFPRYYTYFSLRSYQYDKAVFANHNHLLGRMPGMDGIKTGYTVDAGFTLAASAVRDGHRLVAVVLGEPSLRDRDRDVTALLETGFAVLDGQMAGQPLTVASLLAPLSHPAIRIAGQVDQGSGDSGARSRAALTARSPARDPARQTRSEPAKKNAPIVAAKDKASAKPARKGADTKLAAKDKKASTSTLKGKATTIRTAARDDKPAKAGSKAKAGSDKLAGGDKAKSGKTATAKATATRTATKATAKKADKQKLAATDKPKAKSKPAAKTADKDPPRRKSTPERG